MSAVLVRQDANGSGMLYLRLRGKMRPAELFGPGWALRLDSSVSGISSEDVEDIDKRGAIPPSLAQLVRVAAVSPFNLEIIPTYRN